MPEWTSSLIILKIEELDAKQWQGISVVVNIVVANIILKLLIIHFLLQKSFQDLAKRGLAMSNFVYL